MFYHIKQAKKGAKAPATLRLKPQIPRLPLEDGNGVFLEDSTTPRTCFAHSIAECVEAIKDCPGEEYWVYGTSKLAGFYDPSRKSKKLLGAQSYSDAGVSKFLRKLVGDHYSLRLPAIEVKAINRALEPVFEGVVLDIAGTNNLMPQCRGCLDYVCNEREATPIRRAGEAWHKFLSNCRWFLAEVNEVIFYLCT